MSDSGSAVRLTAALADRYRLERELGQGGMATVYLAHDLKHDRKVAVKVLRPELAAILGAERFLAEIKTTANLQHPHILPLFDSGQAGGRALKDSLAVAGGQEFLFYVMPYIEGESLRDRLNREKQLPIADAVRIATEVASALDYAHRHGVIHRDIKPENILLHDGQALVADFGIALAASNAGGTRMTETGMSLGTPQYMSPEQSAGEREITARSDVFALGCVTYEMLVGDPPFIGSTTQAILAQVITEEPKPPTARRKTIPSAVENAILTALQKLPADRWGSAAEFAAAISRMDTRPRASTETQQSRRPRRSGALWGWVAAAGLALLCLWLLLRPGTPDVGTGTGVARFSIAFQEEEGRPVFLSVPTVALSPDGATLVYYGSHPDGERLFARRLESLTTEPIPGTEGGSSPFLSPDGRSIGFIADGHLKRAPASGGDSQVLADSATAAGATWTRHDEIIFVRAGSLWRVAASGGTPRLVAAPDRGTAESGLKFPEALPDGDRVLAMAVTAAGSRGIFLFSLETGERRQVLPAGTLAARYSPTGHLVYALENGALEAVPFHDGQVSRAPPIVLAEHAQTFGGISEFALSANGSLLYMPEEPFQLVRVSRDGSARPVASVLRYFHCPRVSPDGRWVAVDFTWRGARDVWIQELESGTLSRVTLDHDGHDPFWTPDGKRVTYLSARAGPLGLWLANADGSGVAESLLAGTPGATTGAWTPDGRRIVTGDGADVWMVSGSVPRQATRFIGTRFDESYPAISPDGDWLAYTSNETGRMEVYVRELAGGDRRWQVSNGGGTEPVWARSGRELFYRTPTASGVEGAMMAVTVRTSPSFGTGRPTALFDVEGYEPSRQHANYDVLPDGGLIMVRHTRATELMLVQQWPSLLHAGAARKGP